MGRGTHRAVNPRYAVPMGRVGRCTGGARSPTFRVDGEHRPSQEAGRKGKPGVTRGRKATGLAPLAIDGGSSQPGCRSQEVGVTTARPLLGALVRVIAVMSLALAGVASARLI